MITVAADKHIYRLKEFLPEEIDLRLFDPEKGIPEFIHKSDALLIRTVTVIDNKTLGSAVENLHFVATASAGVDHVDKTFLENNDITFVSAGGSNAKSVAEYVATALFLCSEAGKMELAGRPVGVIGVGNTGSEVAGLLRKLEMVPVLYDPPREMRDPDFISATVNEVLDCDILTFHAELTDTGPHPSRNWLDEIKLSRGKFQLIINASRGEVIDETAVIQACDQHRVEDLIIDVWRNEPYINTRLAQHAYYSTPHIAGYSIEAKLKATEMITTALLNHFNIKQPAEQQDNGFKVFTPELNSYEINTPGAVLKLVHPIEQYHNALQEIVDKEPATRAETFGKLRTERPLRHEFSQIQLPKELISTFPELSVFDFSTG